MQTIIIPNIKNIVPNAEYPKPCSTIVPSDCIISGVILRILNKIIEIINVAKITKFIINFFILISSLNFLFFNIYYLIKII